VAGTTLIHNSHLAREEHGFTLIEVLVTLIVLAVLLLMAIPAYLGFDGRASKSAAQANLRTALPALAAFHSDNDSYAGLTVAALKSYDQGVSSGIAVVSSSAAGYCLRSIHRGQAYYKNGPGGDITTTACS
jgi:prepilin-type N-terminal cleavage/methylation domain-containing protein